MDKAQILKGWEIDDPAYQGTCTAIGLKNPASLTGVQVDQFSLVRGWLQSGDCKNFREATAKYQNYIKSIPASNEGDLQQSLSALERSAEQTLEEILLVIKSADGEAKAAALNVYKRRLMEIASSPEYQAKLERLLQGEAANGFLPQTEKQAVLPASPP